MGGDDKMEESLNAFVEEVVEELIEIPEDEIIEAEPEIEDVNSDADVEETSEYIETEAVETIDVEVDEAIGWSGSDGSTHSGLYDKNTPNQHIITSITGLREELDEIKALKTVYSDGFNVANYYKWDGAAYDEYGYFVSVVPGTSKIKICEGSDIFGVSVGSAGFVGGQDAIVKRDNSYGLVVTSGLVYVQCTLGIEVGNYVTSNERGRAAKTDSGYGYKVLAKVEKDGIEYVAITLGVQADKINSLGLELGEVKEQVDANYKNIITATNVAHQAYDKASNVETNNKEMSDKVDNAIADVEQMGSTVENMGEQVSQAQASAAQAKAIAESAATSAASMKDEAVQTANDAAAQVGSLTKQLEPLTTWEDPNGNKGASYLAEYIDNGLATKAEIEAAETDLEYAKSAILQNAKSLQSLVVSIDKYSVGERSTADGLTLEQATSILEPGVIYVPTKNHDEEYGDYKRSFLRGYLYRWGETPDGGYGWITVDEDYSVDKLNTSAPAVYFATTKPEVVGDFGYWYTEGDKVTDGYEPYTLYKWEEGQWIAVATLAGNSSTRSISQIRQTANSIALEVTNASKSVAKLENRISDTEVDVQTLAAWTKDENGEQYNLASIQQKADDAGASISIVVQETTDGKKVVNAANIVAAINNDESSVGINADRITMTGTTTFLKPGDVGDNGSTVISGSRITTGELDAEKVKVINLQASNIIVTGAGGGQQTVDEALANTIVSSTIYYALSTSTKTPPADDAWSEEAPEKERKKYMWQKTVNVYGDGSSEEKMVCIAGADGEGHIVVSIKSSTGTIYINNEIRTTLIAEVFQDNQNITNEFPDSAFRWEKYDMYGVKDTVWSYIGKAVAVSNLDIYKRAMFDCVLDVEQRIETEDIE